MGDIGVGVLIGQLLVFGLGIAALIWDRQRDKLKPKVDESDIEHTGVDSERLRRTVDEMSRASNAWRDTWLWSLQEYLNQDATWHLNILANQRLMLTLIKELISQLQALGVDTSHVIIPIEPPPPPRIPDPPPLT